MIWKIKTKIMGEVTPGEQPFRDSKEASRTVQRVNELERPYSPHSEETGKELLAEPVIAPGKVTRSSFNREPKNARWCQSIQRDLRRLFSYIQNPTMKVECNFSNLKDPTGMARILAFAKDFADEDFKGIVHPQAFEEMADKYKLTAPDVWGAQGIFNLAYAVKRAAVRETKGTNVIRLTLENGGSDYAKLEYGGPDYVLRGPSDLGVEGFHSYTLMQPPRDVAKVKPLYESQRPIPEPLVEDDPEMTSITKIFENVVINGEKVEVRIIKKQARKGLPTVFTGVLPQYSTGGGVNYFEVWQSGPMLVGNSRGKGMTANNAQEFVAKILDINIISNADTAAQKEAYDKGDVLPARSQKYADTISEYDKVTFAHMRSNVKNQKEIDLLCELGVIRTKKELEEAEAALERRGKPMDESEIVRSYTQADVDEIGKQYGKITPGTPNAFGINAAEEGEEQPPTRTNKDLEG